MIKIGKGYTSFGVISGSSHNTEYMAFNAHDVTNYKAYSSLNPTVYSTLRLYPMRKKLKLEVALPKLFPGTTFNSDQVDTIIKLTGGVKRLVRQFVMGNMSQTQIHERRRDTLRDAVSKDT
jgi:hypothetical protein